MVYAKHLLQSNLINNLPTRFSLITLTGQHLVSRAERTQSSLEETSPPARLGHTFQADREFYATSDFIDRTSEPFVSVLSYKIGKYRCNMCRVPPHCPGVIILCENEKDKKSSLQYVCKAAAFLKRYVSFSLRIFSACERNPEPVMDSNSASSININSLSSMAP